MKYHQGVNKGYQLNYADSLPVNFPSGFRELAIARQLSPRTIQVIQRIMGRQSWGVWPASYDEIDARTLGDPWDNTSYRDFREACPALNLPTGEDGPPLEKLVCLALIRYCLNRAVYDRPRACVYHTLSIELLESLPKTRPSANTIERRTLLWVFTIAIDCWAVATQSITDEAQRLMQQMRLKFPETLSWTMADFESLGRDFLWTDNISGILQQHYISGGAFNEANSCGEPLVCPRRIHSRV
jgi:hypothetical protein